MVKQARTGQFSWQPQQLRHPGERVRLEPEARREVFARYRRGESVDSLVKRYGISRTTCHRILSRMSCERIQDLPLDYIPNPLFDRVSLRESQEILGPLPHRPGTRRVRPPAGLPPYLASLYEVPLLTKEQEVHLFRKMNYLKHQARALRDQLAPLHPSLTAMQKIESYYEQSVAAKNEIIRANLRLVVSIAKRYATSSENLFELVSDGNVSLIRAVEKFDFARGFKFSTYATWAIVKNFARTIPMEHRYHSRFHTLQDEMLKTIQHQGPDQPAQEAAQSRRERQVGSILHRLDDREKQIIRFRFGLDRGQKPMTLKQVGQALGVTKERIRQLESRAITKLRKAALEEGIEIPDEA